MALQLKQAASRMLTLKPLEVVASHLLLVLLLTLKLSLHAYPPMNATLIDPPYELAPSERPPLVVTALQLKQAASRMLTLKPLEVVASHLLLVLLPAALL